MTGHVLISINQGPVPKGDRRNRDRMVVGFKTWHFTWFCISDIKNCYSKCCRWRSKDEVKYKNEHLLNLIHHTSPWTGLELTTLEVIGTDYTGSCKSNYHRSNHDVAHNYPKFLQRSYHSRASEAVARIDSRFRHKLNTGTLPKSNIKIVKSGILPDFAFLILKIDQTTTSPIITQSFILLWYLSK
jgi:hypothetical protein